MKSIKQFNSKVLTLVLIFAVTITYAISNNIKNQKAAQTSVSQVLSFTTIQMPTTVDEDLIFDLNYGYSTPLAIKTSGISFRLHWDSSQITYQSISNLLNDNLLKQSAIRLDSNNYDNDTQTDVYIQFTWFDENQQWPTTAVNTNPRLLTAHFKTNLNYTGSSLKISAVTTLPNTETAPNAEIVWNIKSQAYNLTSPSNNIFSGSFEAMPTYLPQNIFSGDATLCSTDIDGNGKLEPMTDGVLMSRFINGLTGTSLIDGALGQGATRTTAAQITSFLQMPDCQTMLDIDANGIIEAGFDDVIFNRWLFGYDGTDLTENALGAIFQRDGISDLHTWFETHSYFRTVTLEETITVGSTGTSSDGNIVVEPIDNDVSVVVTSGLDSDGDTTYLINVQANGDVQINFDSIAQRKIGSSSCNSEPPESNYPVSDYLWDTYCAYYLGGLFSIADFNRYPDSKVIVNTNTQYVVLTGAGSTLDGNGNYNASLNLPYKTSSQLTSSCSMLDSNCLSKPPILFIHGYSPSSSADVDLKGGSGTWIDFPELMENQGFTPFEFRWRPAARFQDVASELARAINLINQQTNQKVKIIAHSFGGMLVRTLLQGLADGFPNPNVNNLIDKVVTVGTPHSGILDSNQCLNNKLFPIGQHGLLADYISFEACNAITCHQMGESTLSPDYQNVFNTGIKGGLLKQLSCVSTSSANCLASDVNVFTDNISILALIGLKQTIFGNAEEGDGLITYSGERFLPDFSVQGTCGTISTSYAFLKKGFPLSNNNTKLYEKIIGNSNDVNPGDSANFSPPVNWGYRHSVSLSTGFNYFGIGESIPEVGVECNNVLTCRHSTFENVRDFFSDLEVTINQATTQADPTEITPIIFDVTFNKNINYNSFQIEDFTVTPSGSVTSYEIDASDSKIVHISVSNIITSGPVTVTLNAGQIEDTYGNLNQASTSTDNQVTYNPSIDLNAGLVAHYPFDGNANDISGNNHNGTENGGIVYGTGVIGQSIHFDGSNDYIHVEHDDELNVSGDYSFSYWVNRAISSETRAETVFAKGRDCLNTYYAGGGGQYFNVGYGQTWCDRASVSAVPLLPVNEWHHVFTAINNTNNTISMFLDGVLVDEKPMSTYTTTNTYPLVFGRHFTNSDGSGGYTYYFEGMLDDLRIYNRALNEAEILELYNMKN